MSVKTFITMVSLLRKARAVFRYTVSMCARGGGQVN